jgi:biotin operon repressor
MRSQRRTTIIVVGGALAIASVGYGLGTQADDGTAVAESSQQEQRSGGAPPLPFERGAPPGFSDLADSLGVDADKLQDAMRDFHDQQDADRRQDFSQALAKALGISSAKVTDAFDALHQQKEGRLAARLARALDVDADKVKAALEKVKDDRPVPFGDFAATLAKELGLEEADVREALMEIGPPHGRPHRGGPHGRPFLPLRRLAAELGVSRADLRKSLSELRPDRPGEFRAHQRELASFLADRFDLDVDKVSDALGELGPPVGSRHRGGLPDHPPGL